MKKRLLASILSLVLIVTLLPTAALAAGEWDGTRVNTEWYNANNTEFTIDSAAKLAGLAQLVNKGNTFQGKTIKLGTDIDLNNMKWTPIGMSSAPFKGTFDGNKHTISNLFIDGNSSDVGLFGYTTDGEIKNLTVEDALVSGYLNVGVVAGTPYTSEYTNIEVTGHVEVNGMAYVGGVGGKNAYADWTNIIVDVDETSYVKATSTENGTAYRTYVGGVIGFMGEGGHTFKDIESNIDVTGDVCDIGGITGIAHYGNKFENIACSGDVINSNSSDPLEETETGGICGVWHNQAGTSVSFDDCEFTGTVTVNGVVVTSNNLTGGAYNPNNDESSTSGSLIVDGEKQWPLVAEVNGVQYGTLSAAIAAAKAGDVVTLLNDAIEVVKIKDGAATIDLSDNTLTGSFLIESGEFEIRNGSIVNEDSKVSGVEINAGALTLTDVNVTSARHALRVDGKVDVTVDGGEYKVSQSAGMTTHAVNVSDGGSVIIQAGKFTGPKDLAANDSGAAVCVQENSSVVITGGTFSGGKNNTLSSSGTLTVAGGAFDQDPKQYLAEGYYSYQSQSNQLYYVKVDDGAEMVASVNGVKYKTLEDAVNAAKPGDTITLLKGVTIKDCTIKLPATMTNVTIKGAEGAVLKDMTIMADDGDSINYEGITFDGLVFDNSRISITGWRNGKVSVKNLAVTNCVFKNLNDDTNSAPVHINMDADEAVNGFTFTDNEIDGAIGGSKSGVYAQLTGAVTFTGNTINNVAFRPYIIQITTDDGVDDTFTVTNNTFSGSAVGRAQGLGNNAEGTDSVTLTVTNNIFTGITSAQQICYWNFNAETTTADISKNYYDIDISENPSKIYFNKAAQSVEDLAEFGVYPVYTELNEDGTIDATSLYEPVASIGATFYDTLAAAVAAAVDGDTITLYSDNAETVSVARDVTFTLRVVEGKEFSGSIEAGNYTTLTKTENTYAFDYTAPSSSGGGGGSTSYTIAVEDTKNGDITVSPSRASSGSTVTITVDPDEGYELDELNVTDASGNAVAVTKVSDTQYTFTMPRSRVTVTVTFVAEEPLVFSDVPANAYYADAVYWAVENGVTVGTSATTFGPARALTRAESVTFLWRAYGCPEPETTVNPFTDVSETAYYYKAALWAMENGVTYGTSATTFTPGRPVTRAEALTFQWRAAGSPEVTGDGFSDVEADAYYADAVTWAVANGITRGTGGNTFTPAGDVSRAQAVTFLYRQLG